MLQDGLSYQSEKYFSVTVGQGYWSEVWRFIRRSRFMHKTNYSLLPRGWDFRRFPGSRNDWKEPHLEVRTSFPNGVRNAVRTGRGRVSSRSYNCAKFSKRRRTSRCNEMRRWRFAEMFVRFVLKFSPRVCVHRTEVFHCLICVKVGLGRGLWSKSASSIFKWVTPKTGGFLVLKAGFR